MEQRKSFLCEIKDQKRQEKFSAKVEVVKKNVVRTALQPNAIDLVDVFITPISGTYQFYVQNSWRKEEAAFLVNGKLKKGTHNHFVVQDAAGHGVYIVRDQFRRDIEKRRASIFDLGPLFGTRIMGILREFR